jgi:chemotaxis signal transduction protein
MKEKNFYHILGISFDAEQSSVEIAYRQLAMLYHPDHNHTDDAVSVMTEINQAYEILGNPARRRNYDRDHLYLRPNQKKNSLIKTTINQQDWTPRTETQPYADLPLLLIELHHHPYAIHLETILSVLPNVRVRWVEDKPIWIKGVIEYRGQVYPAADLRELLDLSLPEQTGNEPFLLCQINGMTIALQIDKAMRTQQITEKEIKAVPNLGEDLTFSFVHGLFLDGDQVILYLKPEGLFTPEQWQELQAFSSVLI